MKIIVKIHRLKSNYGEYWSNKKLILISDKLGARNYSNTLLHEMFHAAIDYKKRRTKKRQVNEEMVCEVFEMFRESIEKGQLKKFIKKGFIKKNQIGIFNIRK